MEECYICGKPAVTKALIEGAVVPVCAECVKYGKEVKEKVIKRNYTRFHKTKEEEEILPVDNYGKLIRKWREKHKLKLDKLADKLNISASLLRKIEEEKIIPSSKVAQRIEKKLKIKLLESIAVGMEAHSEESNSELTLADIIKRG